MSAPNNSAQLQEDLESVLALLGRSLLSAAMSRLEEQIHPSLNIPDMSGVPRAYDPSVPVIVINKNTMLSAKPDNPNLTIEVSRLINILRNSSENAGLIAKYLHWLKYHDEEEPPPARESSVMRWAVTMRDSLGQCAQILEGRDLAPTPSNHPASVEMEESVQPAHLKPVPVMQPGGFTPHIYNLAKQIVEESKSAHLPKSIIARAERIMQLINPDYIPAIALEEE